MSMLFDTTPTYYSRHLAPPLFMSPFMDAGTAPFPTTPTTAADSESAAALGFTFGARHPTPAELRAHLREAYGGEAGAGEGAETFLRAIPDAQLRHHLAEVGDLEAVMRGVSLTNRATPRGASFTAQGPGCTLRAEGDTYVFEAQTPGVRKQDLSLEVVGRRLQLTISEHDPHMERMRFNDQELALQQAAIDAASSSSPAATSGVASTDPSPPTAEELHGIEVEAPPAPPSPAPSADRTQQAAGSARVAARRTIMLPPDADASSVAVSYDLGILRAYIARTDGTPAVPGGEGEAAKAARKRVSELRQELRTAEKEAAEAEAALHRAVADAQRTEATRRIVIAI